MAKSSAIRKIIWSVDAFQDGADGEHLQRHTAQVLRNLMAKTGATVEPVYILSPDQLNIGLEAPVPWVDHYRPAAEKSLEHILKTVALDGLSKPKVIVQKNVSHTQAVKALGSYALSAGADLIVVGTHARKGMPRMFLGSFAESLLLYSKVPVLVIGPKSEMRGDIESILFPTDLGKQSKVLFDRVVALAAGFGARVTLFHSVQNPIEPVFQSGVYLLGGGWVPVPAYLEEEVGRRRQLATQWAKAAENLGVQTEVLVESGQGGVVASVLEMAARKKISLIAMAAQSGAVASALIGSVTRQVVREASCPVWVLRLKTAEAKKRKKK